MFTLGKGRTEFVAEEEFARCDVKRADMRDDRGSGLL
jgi:hypothetical protein